MIDPITVRTQLRVGRDRHGRPAPPDGSSNRCSFTLVSTKPISTADALLEQGAIVSVVSRFASLGATVTFRAGNYSMTTAPANSRLRNNPLSRFVSARYLGEITPHDAEIRLALGTKRDSARIAANTNVLIGFNHSNRDLADFYALDETGSNLEIRIVDANGARRLQDAIAAGAAVGQAI